MRKEHYWYWLNNIPGLGRVTVARLLENFASPEEIYHASDSDMICFFDMNRTKCSFNNFSMSKNEETVIYSYERLAEHHVTFVHPESSSFPERLKVIPDPPYGLYVKGRMPEREQKAVAIIGARNSTHYGREMARYFGRELSKCGLTVISGLARGIDGMAHQGALEAGNYTLGVLGCGIDVIYPQENYELFAQMEISGGIMSESGLGVTPVAGLFPQRNRLISGMADGILVVEAREKSGTFITVDQGLEQGKEIFALPGRVLDQQSAGCNHLIKLGAHMVTEVSDVLEVLHFEGKHGDSKSIKNLTGQTDGKNLLAPLEKIVYSVLSVEPKYIDDIIYETRLAPGEVCMYLNKLVMSGVVEEPARNYYSMKI